MQMKSLGIVFHSGSYDRVYHGLSFAVAALALGRPVKLFFTYWALEYLKKDALQTLPLDEEARSHQMILKKNIENGHIVNIGELILQAKSMSGKFYACSASMGLLNIARDELIEAVDKSMGIATFLSETQDGQLLFI